MKTATLLFVAALLSGASLATAQTTFRLGVRGGANRALTTVDPASSTAGLNIYNRTADKAAIYAWQAGLVLEAAVGKFAVQPALVFSQKGEKFTASVYYNGVGSTTSISTSSANRYNWLEIPINFVYTSHGDHGLQLFAGPYVAMGVGGRLASTSYYTAANVKYAPYEFDRKVTYGPDTNNHRFDAGLNFGLGYRQGPLQVQAGFGLGLVNLHQEVPSFDPGFSPLNSYNFYNDTAYNRVLQLTGTYFFPL